MKANDFEGILSAISNRDRNVPIPGVNISGVKVKKVNGRALSYASRHRGSWFKPEYDLTEMLAPCPPGVVFNHTSLYAPETAVVGAVPVPG